MLIYCTDGEGWYRIHGARYALRKDECVILPAGTPYAFGADNDNHLDDLLAPLPRRRQPTLPAFGDDRPAASLPATAPGCRSVCNSSRSLFHCFRPGLHLRYMRYTSACLHLFLASFLYIEPLSVDPHLRRPEILLCREGHPIHAGGPPPPSHAGTTGRLFQLFASHFSMLFQRETGIPPISYLARLKIQKPASTSNFSDLKNSRTYPWRWDSRTRPTSPAPSPGSWACPPRSIGNA